MQFQIFRGPSTSILGISGLLKTVIAAFYKNGFLGHMGWFVLLAVGSHENLPRVNHQSETKSIDIDIETTSQKKIQAHPTKIHTSPKKRIAHFTFRESIIIFQPSIFPGEKSFVLQGGFHAGCTVASADFSPDPRLKSIADIIFDARKSGPRGPRRHGIAEGNLEKDPTQKTKLLEKQ